MILQSQSWAYTQRKPSQKDTRSPMFIAALFTMVKIWKKLIRPLIDEQIKKMLYVYTMEYYSAIKKNEIIPFSARECSQRLSRLTRDYLD